MNKKSSKAHNSSDYNERVGETRMMNCGMEATIIEYFGADDITVQFEDGTIRRNKRYYNFKRGNISVIPKDLNYNVSRFGEVKERACGLRAVIICYVNSYDVDVAFENGEIMRGCTYQNFIKGRIKPNSMHKTKKLAKTMNLQNDRFKKRIGEAVMQNCGQIATIVGYKNSCAVDVEFPDGTKVTDRKYDDFMRGRIKNPTLGHHRLKDRTGETRIMNCGLSATIIRYGNSRDIDIRFENGKIATNKYYRAFCMGKIGLPT